MMYWGLAGISGVCTKARLLVKSTLGATTFGTALATAASSDSTAIVNVRDYGAKGDGLNNDTDAFHAASLAVMSAGGGTLFIPAGTYIVGKQDYMGPGTAYLCYKPRPIIQIDNCRAPVIIRGEAGTVLKAADGLKFGAFNPVTTTPHYDSSMPFINFSYKADAYVMVQVSGNTDVTISDLQLDGNIMGLEIGGPWGDVGRQCWASGIGAMQNEKLTVKNVHTHHHGLDGIQIGYTNLRPNSVETPTALDNVVSEYNARQGLSWIGGIGLNAVNCKFNHTGKSRFSSPPGAGLDIEAEDSVIRNGTFTDCEFSDNSGCCIVADTGDSANILFSNCSIWGTTNWSLWPSKPYMRFVNCDIHGSIVNLYGSVADEKAAVQFTACTIDDAISPSYGPSYASTFLMTAFNAGNVILDGCTISALRSMSLLAVSRNFSQPLVLRNCVITHGYAAANPGGPCCTLIGANLENVQFKESFAVKPAATYAIVCVNVTVQDNVSVSGPYVLCKISPKTGRIPPGTYRE
jgi:hypothetical protein